jgi:hypothetical protein
LSNGAGNATQTITGNTLAIGLVVPLQNGNEYGFGGTSSVSNNTISTISGQGLLQ